MPGEGVPDDFGRLLQGEDRQALEQRERVSIAREEIERLAPPGEADGELGSWVLEARPADLPGQAERSAVTLREIPQLRLSGRDPLEMPVRHGSRPAERAAPQPELRAFGEEPEALGLPDASRERPPAELPSLPARGLESEGSEAAGQLTELPTGEGRSSLGTTEADAVLLPVDVPGMERHGTLGQPVELPIGEGWAFLGMPDADPFSPSTDVPGRDRNGIPGQPGESLVGGEPEAGGAVEADRRSPAVDVPGEERAEFPGPPEEPSLGEGPEVSLAAGAAGPPLEGAPGRGLAIPPGFLRSVDGALRGFLGLGASGEQVQRLWGLMSPEQQIAFLTRPSRVLPEMRSLPPTVFEVDGVEARSGLPFAKNLLTAFDDLLVELPDPARVRQFFDGLTRIELLRLVAERAPDIGGLAGAPFDVRYAANEQLAARDWLRLRETADPDADRGAAQLAGLMAGGSRLLEYVLPEGLPRGGRGQDAPRAIGGISQVVGDLNTARRVAFLLPGTGTSLDGLPRVADQAARLYDLTQGADGGESAVVTYFGLRTPLAPGAELNAAQFQQARQQQAAQQVRELVTGLLLPSGVRTTMVGYSLGSSVLKQLVKTEGVKTDAVVLLGLPRRELRKVPREVAGQQSDLYGNSTAGEPIEKIDEEWLAALARAERAAKNAGTAPDVPAIEGELVDGTDDYLAAGSRELQQIVAVVNDTDLAAEASNLASQFVGA
ncbi:MAG: alpha/beta hydrolase [Thermoanaerobaculia bacterium]